ncbi:MAG TPA: Uma2 family endonuclease [Chthoniobacteraceae bacterium]|jgi:Uma2 family endonuclease|nr:Uma2 family endonuclease [Chthoniobacteraceae bacterium]
MTWQEILEDPDVARLEYRVESDRWGNLVMSPPPSSWHGDVQSEITTLLGRLLPHGRSTTECPIQTSEGVRACDVAWASRARRNSTNRKPVFTVAPEICVEIQSPSNSLPQIMERKDWFFATGAIEFWYCDPYGGMHFYDADGPLEQSVLCPVFPATITVD